MENTSKALLIAGGILITIMVVSLLVVLWGRLSGFFEEEHNSVMVKQTAEFNEQFENYNGKSIRGNELISIMNKIIDYNRTYSDIDGYERVKIEIDLQGKQESLLYDNSLSGNDVLIRKPKITNETNDTEIQKIADISYNLVNNSGIIGIDDTKLQKLSSEISNIVDDEGLDSKSEDTYKKVRAKKLKNILGYEVSDNAKINKIKKIVRQYYQYTQFKRAMFDCTSVEYDISKSVVNKITFKVQIENNQIKFN